MEEPENGIHPANLQAVVDLIQDLAVDPHQAPSWGNPFRQIIVNTHSPGVVQLCERDDLLLATARPVGDGRARALSLLPFRGSRRADPEQDYFSEADALAYLTSPSGAHLKLPPELIE